MAETITSITERLLAEVPEQYDTTEGTYTYDIEKSVAVEFDNAYDQLETVRKQSHVSTASGTYLEKCVAHFGLYRKSATYATGNITVTGTSGAVLPVGSKVAAGNVMFTVNDTVTIGDDGTASAPVICDTAGTQGNVLAGYINRFPVTISGLLRVTTCVRRPSPTAAARTGRSSNSERTSPTSRCSFARTMCHTGSTCT